MAPGGVAGGAPARSTIEVRDLDDPHPDMNNRLRDLGFCHLLVDARDSGGEISLIGRNVFREGQDRPRIDEFAVFSEGLAAELERGA